MKRRDFIVGAASVAGSMYAGQLRAQTPCAPGISGASSSNNCPLPQGGAGLSDAAAQLSPGQWSLDPITWNTFDNNRWDISWQNRTGFWDDIRREMHYMGKPQASAGGLGRQGHWIYSEATDTWRRTTLTAALNHYGHIWGVTFDHFTGDYYYIPQDPEPEYERTLLHMDRSVEDGLGETNSPWTTLPLADVDLWSPGESNIYQGSPCYHPNLLGPGRPGIFCLGAVALSYFDVINQEWTRTLYRTTAAYDARIGAASCYIPGKDIAIFTDGNQKDSVYTIIRAGEANNTAPDQVTGPISIKVGPSGAKLLVDPRDDGTIMLLEAAGNRVWTNANSGATADWVLESFTHPFNSFVNFPYVEAREQYRGGTWTVCSIPRYGVVVGMASYNSPGGTLLWRPG